jgi:hypothetical protein
MPRLRISKKKKKENPPYCFANINMVRNSNSFTMYSSNSLAPFIPRLSLAEMKIIHKEEIVAQSAKVRMTTTPSLLFDASSINKF